MNKKNEPLVVPCHCKVCGHSWNAKIQNSEIRAFAGELRRMDCPNCKAVSKHLTMGIPSRQVVLTVDSTTTPAQARALAENNLRSR